MSTFGQAFIKEVLANPYFKVTTIVLAKLNRWEKFICKLQMTDQLLHQKTYRKNYHSTTKNILKYIQKNYSDVVIQFTNDANNADEINKIPKDQLILCGAFPQIFSKDFIKNANGKAINFHPSFLPRCRGANPIYWTIFSGEPCGGISAHFITTKLDQGAIIARKKISFDKETIVYDELYKLVLQQLPTLINDTALFFKENKKAIIQNNKEATYFRNDQPIHRKIYWQTETISQISAKIRAGAAFSYTASGKLIYIRPPVHFFSKSPAVTNHFDQRIENGTIISLKHNTMSVKGLNGYITFEYNLERKLEDLPNNLFKRLNWQYLSSKIDILDRRNLKIGEKLC